MYNLTLVVSEYLGLHFNSTFQFLIKFFLFNNSRELDTGEKIFSRTYTLSAAGLGTILRAR